MRPAALDANGGVVSQLKYYAYGRIRSQTAGPVTDKLFTGHQKEGDLYFMKARFYDPLLGRFMAADSIVPNPADPQSLNRYSYVLGNPLRYTDPTGRNPYDGGCRQGVDCPGDVCVLWCPQSSPQSCNPCNPGNDPVEWCEGRPLPAGCFEAACAQNPGVSPWCPGNPSSPTPTAHPAPSPTPCPSGGCPSGGGGDTIFEMALDAADEVGGTLLDAGQWYGEFVWSCWTDPLAYFVPCPIAKQLGRFKTLDCAGLTLDGIGWVTAKHPMTVPIAAAAFGTSIGIDAYQGDSVGGATGTGAYLGAPFGVAEKYAPYTPAVGRAIASRATGVAIGYSAWQCANSAR
jgi:RHS repeat-associated protein